MLRMACQTGLMARIAASGTHGSRPLLTHAVAGNTITTTSSISRSYPDEPRVGVGVVVLRPGIGAATGPEVLLIRRAKEPSLGEWCFPGGSLELGESMAECAVREVKEETGLTVRCDSIDQSEGYDLQLRRPTPFAAVDSIMKDADGRLKFHYAVVDVAATLEDPLATPTASDDVDGVQWVEVQHMRKVQNLTRSCARFAEQAVSMFKL